MSSEQKLLNVLDFFQGRKYTLEEKVMCLQWWKTSPRLYRFLGQSLVLPTPRTLMTLQQSIPLRPGKNKIIYDAFKSRNASIQDKRKLVVALCFDEIALQPHLDLDIVIHNLVGVKDWGELYDTESKTVESPRTGKIADHAIMFSLRCLFDGKVLPLQYGFSNAQTKGPMLARLIKDIVKELEICGFTIVAIICDQGTSNVAAIDLLRKESDDQKKREGRHDFFKLKI